MTAAGTYDTPAGRRRRYRCEPITGTPHRFSVPVTAAAARPMPSPPPACLEHPGSKVVRNGSYGKRTAKPRQMYRCTPLDGSKPHRFTPALPRDHVHEGVDSCEHCDELRGVHRGETAVARRHSWSTRTVVRGLEMLARGMPYAEVGRWARRTRDEVTEPSPQADSAAASTEPTVVDGPTERDPFAPLPEEPSQTTTAKATDEKPKRSSAAARAARNAWHVAADWVEAFAPVIYEPEDEKLRALAYGERARLDAMIANGEVLERPQVLLLDDVPVYGRDLDDRSKKSRRDAGFYVLAAAETHWGADGPAARLRLLRAMPKSNTPAWRLVFDELGYDPDFVVADAGTGLVAAVETHFDASRTKLIPSMWHLTQRIEAALADTKGARTATPFGKALLPPLADHVSQLHRRSAALADPAAWTAWWDDLEALLAAHQLPLDKIRTQRRNNEARMAAVVPDLARHPLVPVSTGGLETLIAKHVKPQLAMRRTSFGNLERTNLLLDLVVADHHGAFDDHAQVAQLLRADTTAHDGWTVALRSIADPRPKRGSYSSLRDATLLNDLARERGLL